MRLTKRLQRKRSQYSKGQPIHWRSPDDWYIPKYRTSQILNARRLLKQVAESSTAIKTDYYLFIE